MPSWIRSSLPSRFAGVVVAALFCGMGPVWAGGGGSDGGVSQPFLQQVCGLVGATSCPQLPTLTQLILGISGYQNTPPDFVRGPLGNFAGICSVSENGSGLPLCVESNAVTTVNPLAPSSIALTDLRNLTPLAFQAGFVPPGPPPGPPIALPVALGSPSANSFFYPVLTGPDGQHRLNVVFDYPPWTSGSLVKGQAVGSFKFPLVILNSDKTETPVLATLNLTAICTSAMQSQQQGQQQTASCLAGTVTGIGAKPLSAAQLGIQFGLQLGPSPNSSTPHAIFTLGLPVIVTLATDPVYFGVDNTGTPTFINQFSGQRTAFSKDDLGFAPTLVGRPIGVSPNPAPLCPADGCPSTTTTFYAFCATIAGTPAAATFASVGTEGTTYASSPVGQPQPLCP